eukprot:CAMPEP_0116014036 /NCGR_PEP_ID=MMETSP0321-20121206/6056_1 /TAXON_ID=163516 /ORGANISM="Leptocylindrus danicus var. danicus, Strain B650" /LENGTH=833 /DNA_ID=CAMNT_0003483647 /DNA_START=2262 /DNA_END=4760 /DNA_ORIENTATION=+
MTQPSATVNSTSSKYNNERSLRKNCIREKHFPVLVLIALALLSFNAICISSLVTWKASKNDIPGLDSDTLIRLSAIEHRNQYIRGAIDESEDDKIQSNDSKSTPFLPSNLLFVTRYPRGDTRNSQQIERNLQAWEEMYRPAGYAIYSFAETELRDSIKSQFPEHLPAFDLCENERERIDLARYILLHHFGGISIDAEVARPLKRLDRHEAFHSHHAFSVGIDNDFMSDKNAKEWLYSRQKGFSTHCIIAAANHPLLNQVIERVTRNLNRRPDVDSQIAEAGYSPTDLADASKMNHLKREWMTRSGPLTDVVLENEDVVDILPREDLMHEHPGGMRFSELQFKPNTESEGVVNLAKDAKSFIMYDESHLALPYHFTNEAVYFSGIIRDASTILPEIFSYMMDLNCNHHISIHLVAGGGIESCKEKYMTAKSDQYKDTACARFDVIKEPDDVSLIPSRVDRIAYLRDFQREHLRLLLEGGKKDDIVIVADIDLHELPEIKQLMHETDQMVKYHRHDVICSLGVMSRPFGYYDTFATVLLPDTFAYPLKGRLVPEFYEGEDMSLVRSNEVYGKFSQWDLLEYFENKGRANASEMHSDDNNTPEFLPVPVKSCFGGLAIYSAPKWLDTTCHYNKNATSLTRYANKHDGRACEHVVFHECLQKGDTKATIAIQPALKTEWNDNKPFGNRLVPGNIHQSLVTYSKQSDRGDMLVNGLYSLRINESGRLVVEKRNDDHVHLPSTTVVHTLNDPVGKTPWTHMFLMLCKNGNLQLLKQVPNTTNQMGRTLCKATADYCRIPIWKSQSGRSKELNAKSSYALKLEDDGHLIIVDENSNDILW